MDADTALERTAPTDYRLVCRTCLASDAEFYKLDSPLFLEDDDSDQKPVSFMECLRYCTRLVDNDESENLEFPTYICTECSASLQVSYNFIKNALEAHEILRQKLSENSEQQQRKCKVQRKNGVIGENGCKSAGLEDGVDTEATKMRFRCKICNEKVETKKTLKEHIKLHLDIISYCCELCSFECKKRTLLFDHYKLAHNMQPTRDQLKPKTKQPVKKEHSDSEDPISQEMEKIHNTQINDEYMPNTQYAVTEQQEDLDMKLFLTPASSNASAAYVEAAAAATAIDVPTDTHEHRTSITKDLQQYGTDQFNITANELSVGNEFIVMADGTVEEVMGNGVVIEYINAADDGVTLENGLVLDNIMQVQPTGDADQAVTMDMDVDDIIIEEGVGNELSMSSLASISMEPETTVQTLQNIEDELPPPSIITTNTLLNAKRIKCKICTSNFLTQDQLKTHMLSHNEIPHFFCDQCTFYTFFKIDLTQHYKTKHKLQPTQKQLQPKNKVRPADKSGDFKHIYACDLCLFETRIKSHLRRHYLSQHQEEATEVQLRPTIDESAVLTVPEISQPESSKKSGKSLRPDYPKGLNCKKCSKTFYWREKLKDHYRQHGLEESNNIDATVGGGLDISGPGTSLLKHNTFQYHMPQHDSNSVNSMLNTNLSHNNYNSNVDASVLEAQAIVDAAVAEAQAASMQINLQMNQPAPDIIMDIPVATTISTTTVPMDATGNASDVHGMQQQAVNVMGGYACPQIPSDAIPQVVETDTTIDNSELDFVFNDALFEDFEEDENEDEENEEDDGADLQDLLLTSDDDFDDMLQEQQQQQQLDESGVAAGDASTNSSTYQPYCVHCNKKYLSQYQFENHMFVHRGLAPYRCEMCTNLYNTKRALIRHYRAVHKRIPTRDMIQAKGDKVVVDHTPIEHLNLIEQKAVTLMCAKCPYESVDLQVMQMHLNTIHGLADENYILQKLPFECPRCIRSYATRARLIRHLERSHSVATIIQQQRMPNNTMRNQLQQQQSYITIKDSGNATSKTTTTTTVAALTTPSIAVTTTSTTTNSSCGKVYKGINKNQITQSQKLKMLLETDTDC
uniref:Zinc finger protein 550 n=1 Tax=Zeugodacus cucurbitae TaxID=28588 RepID=A0A0A1WMN7_ZEUCU